MTPRIQELPYPSDSSAVFEALSDRPWAVFLDSGRPFTDSGRFDVLAAEPMTMLISRGQTTEVRTRAGEVAVSAEEPLALLQRCLAPLAEPVPGLPFAGGAIGYFGYDLARRLQPLPARARDGEAVPQMAVGIYDWALVVDHRERRAWLVGQGRDVRTRERWAALVAQLSTPPPPVSRSPLRLLGPLRSNLDRDAYAHAFARIQHYIREGDCYQVNLAQRFAAPARGDAWDAYRRLRRLSPAPHAAYLNLPWGQVLSASPERFLQLVGDRVQTRPIKGTRPRSADPAQDRTLAQGLRASAKDRAENLMIVDLLRNDLGKVCRYGSVRVPQLFQLESFATVHHLVSTVTGELAAGRSALDLLRACFPGGSITGAPKRRAMEIIDELEPHRRGVYCGAIGYVGFDGAMDTSIAIRTLVWAAGEVRFWAGGGIVADSRCEAEYQESFDKAAAMHRLLALPDAAEPEQVARSEH